MPIGRPIANTRLYVLDSYGEPAPAGISGEIYVSGAGIARGYLERPDLTAQRFLKDPFAPDPEARMYRTGDLGRWLPHGNIEFVGRKDFQVKIRGFRVELGEIEARLSQYPDVDQAVVLAKEDQQGDKLLVAYYTSTSEARRVDPAALRAYLAGVLPEYMTPVAYVQLDRLPQTLTGKLDRGALPAPDDQAYLSDSGEEPRTATERKLASVWTSMLPVSRVGLRSDFFRLGGHSLKAVQLAARIRDSFGVELSVGTVFRDPSLEGMAAAIEKAEVKVPAQELHSGRAPDSHEGDLPLSVIEESIWSLTRINPDYLAHYVHTGAYFEGELDLSTLERSITQIVQRHEVLRTTYLHRDGRPYRVVVPFLSVPMEMIDLRGFEEYDRKQRALEILTAAVKIPFDLASGPLVRIKLLRLGDRENVLAIIVHHIIGDSWSLSLFARDLEHLYERLHQQKTPALAPLPIQYSDYALWQRARLSGKEIQSSFAYWRERLSGISKLGRLPADLPVSETSEFRQETVSITVDAATMAALKRLSEEQSATPFMIVLAIFLLLLSRITGEEDVSVVVPSSDRSHSHLEKIMGFIMATLVLHATSRGNPAFMEFLEQVSKSCREAYEHQEAPFVMVRQALPNAANFTRIIFDYINVPDFVLRLPGLRAEPFSAKLTTPIQMDLITLIRDREMGTEFSFLYNATRYSRDRIIAFTRQFEALINKVVQFPNKRINEYSV